MIRGRPRGFERRTYGGSTVRVGAQHTLDPLRLLPEPRSRTHIPIQRQPTLLLELLDEAILDPLRQLVPMRERIIPISEDIDIDTLLRRRLGLLRKLTAYFFPLSTCSLPR